MKKNKMMRLASALLVAVLLTTSVISGTYAKYVTKADGSDTARVAKWGVEVKVGGSNLFSEEYEDGNKTVVSVNSDHVVAPGTKNDKGVTFSIKGEPEVAVKVDVKVTGTTGDKIKEVFLKAGTYADMTTGNDENDTFVFAEDYYPVVFTLTNGAGDELAKGKLSEIETYLEGLSGEYDPNENLSTVLGTNVDGDYKLTWAWDFPTTENIERDQKDTLLGNLAVTPDLQAKFVDTRFYPLAVNETYCNNIDFKVAITVTQID